MRYFYALFITALSVFIVAFAPPFIIKGKVVLPTGKPAVNVSVVIKGSAKSTRTNSAGGFSIELLKLPATLVFSAAGYRSIEYKLTDKNRAIPIKITLKEETALMEEVVVTGYASALRKTHTASAVRSTGVALSSAGRSTTESYDKAFAMADRSVAHVPPSAPAKTSAPPRERKVKGEASHDVVPQSKQPLTKLLTAGEVSDFKKWKLWSDYTEQEFKQWSKHWNLVLKTRFCVQVQNQDHKAVVGQKVFLLNSTNDTIWQAITDNTGKAELWAATSSDKSTYRIRCDKEVVNTPVEFEDGINRIILKRSCEVSNIVDIAFVVDATGSMGDEIHYLQEELQDVIAATADKYKNVNLHAGAVFYRDRGDEYLTRHINFQTDPNQLINFIKKQSAGGGGDFPEAVEDALSTAIDSLHWHTEARSRILFLVLDAPPHDAAKEKMNKLMRRAATKGIRVVPIVCSGIDKSTEYLMRCLALSTNGSYVFLTDDSGIGNPHIKPTTDEFKVELLNNLLPRVIGEMIYVPLCDEKQTTDPNIATADSTIVLVYPNPTRDNITIQSSQELKEVFITDFTGKILMKVPPVTKNGRAQVYLGNYPSGTYLVKYYAEGKGWSTKKVVLIH